MVINVSRHPWRSKEEYDEMRYPVDEDLFSVATREMEWEDKVAGTVETLGENNDFYYETLIELSGMKKEPNTKPDSIVKKIFDKADKSVQKWCWEPDDFDEDPGNWDNEMWVVRSKSVINKEIGIVETFLDGTHDLLEYTIKSHRLRVGPETMKKWIMDAVVDIFRLIGRL